MKAIFFLILTLLSLSHCTIDLTTVDDSWYKPLLSGNWQAILPNNLAGVKDQILKQLSPTSNKHMESQFHNRRPISKLRKYID